MIRVLEPLGSVATDAMTIANAGGKPATCTTTRIMLPFTDPNTGLNYYDDTQCSVAGDSNLHSAALIVANPSVYFAELANPYKPPPAPVQQVTQPPLISVATPTAPVPTTPAPVTPPAQTPAVQAQAETAGPAGWNIWSDPSSPFYIGVPTVPITQQKTTTTPQGTTVTVQTTDPTAAGYQDPNATTGFWQQPIVQSVTSTATALPWWVWVAVAVAVYQMTKGKR